MHRLRLIGGTVARNPNPVGWSVLLLLVEASVTTVTVLDDDGIGSFKLGITLLWYKTY